MKKRLGILLALLATTSVCVAQLPDPVKDMATVVFYRVPSLTGALVNFTVRANGAELCRLSNNRYFTSQLKPGKVDFTSVAGGLSIPDKEVLSMDLEANKVYYVQGDVKVRVFTGKLIFTEVTESTAKKKLPDIKPDNCETAKK